MKDDTLKAKPQPTLHGYTAWALQRLVEAKGRGEGPVAAWIIDRWIDENGDVLERDFGITRDQFLSRDGAGIVIRHPSSTRKTDGRHGS